MLTLPNRETLITISLVMLWYSSNIGVLLLNKFLLSNYGFRFPIFLTLCHMSASAALSYLSIVFLRVFPLQKVRSWGQFFRIASLGVVFCGSVVGGNISLRYLPVSFNQAIGATTPFFTAVFAYLMTMKTEQWVTYAALVPVVAGVVIATGGEPSFHLIGFIVCLGATAARAFKSVLQGILLSSDEPVDPSVLYAQGSHRFEGIWSEGGETLVYCQRDDEYVILDNDVTLLKELHAFSFHGLYQLGYLQLDRALITALLERWRPQTLTFHMPVGEMTITLQDMEVIGGVAVDGLPVIGVDRAGTITQWQDAVEELLGFCLMTKAVNRNRLLISAIHRHLQEMPIEVGRVELMQYARCIIMTMLGGHYLSYKFGNYVFLVYLDFLCDAMSLEKYPDAGSPTLTRPPSV